MTSTALTSAQTTAPDDRSTEFKPVQGGEEGASAGALLIAAYLVLWGLLLGFLLMSWRRQMRLDARLGELERALAGADRAKTPAAE